MFTVNVVIRFHENERRVALGTAPSRRKARRLGYRNGLYHYPLLSTVAMFELEIIDEQTGERVPAPWAEEECYHRARALPTADGGARCPAYRAERTCMDTTPIPLARSLVRAVARACRTPELPAAPGIDPVCGFLLRSYGPPDAVALAFARVGGPAPTSDSSRMRESIRERLFA